MFPQLLANNARNSRFRYGIKSCYRFLSFPSLCPRSNFNYQALSQFGIRYLFSSKALLCKYYRNVISSFGDTVSRIVQWGSYPQVFRSYARRIVAFVENPKPLHRFPKVNQPRISVSVNIFSVSKLSIAILIKPSNPHPAISQVRKVCRYWSALVHFLPKTLLGRFRATIRVARFLGLCNYFGRFFHTNSMTELSRFWCSFTSDGVFIVSNNGPIATRKWGGLFL